MSSSMHVNVYREGLNEKLANLEVYDYILRFFKGLNFEWNYTQLKFPARGPIVDSFFSTVPGLNLSGV